MGKNQWLFHGCPHRVGLAPSRSSRSGLVQMTITIHHIMLFSLGRLSRLFLPRLQKLNFHSNYSRSDSLRVTGRVSMSEARNKPPTNTALHKPRNMTSHHLESTNSCCDYSQGLHDKPGIQAAVVYLVKRLPGSCMIRHVHQDPTSRTPKDIFAFVFG